MNEGDVVEQDKSVLTSAFEQPEENPAPRRRRSTLVRVLIGMVVAVVVIVAGTAGAGVYFANKLDKNIERIGNVFGPLPREGRPGKEPVAADALNVLLVGSDVRAKGQTTGSAGTPTGGSERSDTIMIVHIPADRKHAYVVSLPRDSWVPVPGRGITKINAAYAYGGPTLLVRTIEQLTDVQIDHYAQVDFAGFKSMTDAVGGVDIPAAGHLDGESALAYVRERKTLANGDFDRIKRQHRFLRALMSRAKPTDPVAFTKLMDAVTRSVSIDDGMSGGDLRSLALGMRSVRAGDIHFHTAPTKGTGMVGDQSVVFLDPSADRLLWEAIRNDRMSTWKK
ncbi:MAG TPA: LCP family protein [Mycobacteriales bacterium]|nr:LCP family protein [Mycobacteriales bacterium]